MDCIFCKIISGDIPCYKLYEDDLVICFLDVNPKANGHTLVIPKEHTLDITTIDNNVLSHVFEVAKDMAKLLEDKLNISGYTLVQNNGEPQEVKHFHLHIIPTYSNDIALDNVEDVYNKIKSN